MIINEPRKINKKDHKDLMRLRVENKYIKTEIEVIKSIKLTLEIQVLFKENKGRYGAHRACHVLLNLGRQ